jgi:hypothetical protein
MNTLTQCIERSSQWDETWFKFYHREIISKAISMSLLGWVDGFGEPYSAMVWRDVVRALAETDAFEQSRRDRKRPEMLFAHRRRILRLGRLRLT